MTRYSHLLYSLYLAGGLTIAVAAFQPAMADDSCGSDDLTLNPNYTLCEAYKAIGGGPAKEMTCDEAKKAATAKDKELTAMKKGLPAAIKKVTTAKAQVPPAADADQTAAVQAFSQKATLAQNYQLYLSVPHPQPELEKAQKAYETAVKKIDQAYQKVHSAYLRAKENADAAQMALNILNANIDQAERDLANLHTARDRACAKKIA